RQQPGVAFVATEVRVDKVACMQLRVRLGGFGKVPLCPRRLVAQSHSLSEGGLGSLQQFGSGQGGRNAEEEGSQDWCEDHVSDSTARTRSPARSARSAASRAGEGAKRRTSQVS